MKKRSIIILIILILTVGGIQGVRSYNKYKCTNIQSVNWQFHKLANCAVYYNEEGNLPDSPPPQVGGNVEEDESAKIDLLKGWKKVLGVHIRTFTEIDKSYAKDKRSVYYKADKVEHANPMSFLFFGGEYFFDRTSVFWRGKIVDKALSSTFELFEGDDRYGKSSDKEYFNGKEISIAPLASSTRFLLSPFDGEEVTRSRGKEIFWRPAEIHDFNGVAIALADSEGGFTWISDERVRNTGQFIWTPSASSSSNVTYNLVFYMHKGGDEVVKIDTGNKFLIKDKGKPAVVLLINFSDEEKVRVEPDDVVYISWASSNVERCYLTDGTSQPFVGHMMIKFPQSGDVKVTRHHYNIECVAADGYIVNDSFVIESVAPDKQGDDAG